MKWTTGKQLKEQGQQLVKLLPAATDLVEGRNQSKDRGICFASVFSAHCLTTFDRRDTALDSLVADVVLDDDTRVQDHGQGIYNTTDPIVLQNFRYLRSLPDEELLTLVTGDRVVWQDESSWSEAVLLDPTVIEYVKEQTEELALLAVRQYWPCLFVVRQQTPVVVECALEQDWRALEAVKRPTVEQCLMALDRSAKAKKYVPDTLLWEPRIRQKLIALSS